jgi:Ca2+-transporting ATPase
MSLALGVERMARRKTVVRRLASVEALGSVTVIATDKTGTLTENRMEVRSMDAADAGRALRAMVLANDADLMTGAGDPLELGLLRHAAEHGTHIAALRASHPALSMRPFDSTWKYSRVTVHENGRLISYVKGASEVILARCAPTPDLASWNEKADAYAREGFRVLALAWTEGESEQNLSVAGLVLLWDPPRPEVREAIDSALAAGIRVVMVTGDHPATALSVAHQIGIPSVRVLTGEDLADYDGDALADALREVNVFARVRPEQKLAIVRGLQSASEIVAMTGDGVNDAPALKQADVGVAMGQRGSDVSRETADLVILDDNFATIVGAVEEGRGIYENITSFLRFLFSTNLSEVLLVGTGALLAMAIDLRDSTGALMIPLTAAQILWINLITDGPPALALAFDRTPGVMARPPRPPAAPLLDAPSTVFVIGAGTIKALIALGVLGALPLAGYDLDTTRASAFHLMAIGQLLLTFPSRHSRVHALPNPYLHAAVGGGIALQIAVAALPWTARLLGDVALPVELWAVVACGAIVNLVAAEALTHWVWRR